MSETKDPLRRVLLVRHGSTAWNRERRWQGRADVPLSPEGLEQAERAAAALVRDAAIDVLAFSTARRAAQTAAVIKGAFDLAGRTPVMLPRDDLVEIDVGEWSGLLHQEVRERWPETTDKLWRDETFRYGGTGETLGEVADRVEAALLECLEQVESAQTLLVVTHGAVIASLTSRLVGLPAGGTTGALGSIRNCHWAELQRSDSGWRIERWNANS